MIDDILLFIKVVDAGSFAAVEKMLLISKSTISRRMQALETDLGDSLFNRSTHGIALTMFGHNLYKNFKEYENKLAEMLGSVSKASKKAQGRLNVLLPYSLVYFVLAELGEFLAKYPEMQINIMHSYLEFNMQKELYDIAIINYPPKQQTQKIKLLGSDKILAICSPKYIETHGFWRNPDEHAKHVVVGKLTPGGNLVQALPLFKELTAEVHYFNVRPEILLSTFSEAKHFVMNHNGVAGLPLHFIREELEQGMLVRILPDYHAGIMNYYLMRNISENDRRYQVFYQFIQECLEKLHIKANPGVNPAQFFHG